MTAADVGDCGRRRQLRGDRAGRRRRHPYAGHVTVSLAWKTFEGRAALMLKGKQAASMGLRVRAGAPVKAEGLAIPGSKQIIMYAAA